MTQIAQIDKKISQMRSAIRFSKAEDRDPFTEKIIACCYQVHSELGPGFSEKVYQKALCVSLGNAGLAYVTEKNYRVAYQGRAVGFLRVDLVVEDRVIVEVKALAAPTPAVFLSQVLSYLKVSKLKVGLLVNFGMGSCEVKRISN